jgi:hypothetical protein
MIHRLLACRLAGTDVLVITPKVLVVLPRYGSPGLAKVTLLNRLKKSAEIFNLARSRT